MKKLFFTFLLMSRIWSFSHAACSGLTTAQYNTEIAQMSQIQLQGTNFQDQSPYWTVWASGIITYRNQGGTNSDAASRCAIIDAYQVITGFNCHGLNTGTTCCEGIKHQIYNVTGNIFNPCDGVH